MIKRILPVLHIDIAIPLVRVRTTLMAENVAHGCREYIVLQVKIHKWHWDIAIYDTYRRISERN